MSKILELNPEGHLQSQKQRRVLRTIAFAQLRAENNKYLMKNAPESPVKTEKPNFWIPRKFSISKMVQMKKLNDFKSNTLDLKFETLSNMLLRLASKTLTYDRQE